MAMQAVVEGTLQDVRSMRCSMLDESDARMLEAVPCTMSWLSMLMLMLVKDIFTCIRSEHPHVYDVNFLLPVTTEIAVSGTTESICIHRFWNRSTAMISLQTLDPYPNSRTQRQELGTAIWVWPANRYGEKRRFARKVVKPYQA